MEKIEGDIYISNLIKQYTKRFGASDLNTYSSTNKLPIILDIACSDVFNRLPYTSVSKDINKQVSVLLSDATAINMQDKDYNNSYLRERLNCDSFWSTTSASGAMDFDITKYVIIVKIIIDSLNNRDITFQKEKCKSCNEYDACIDISTRRQKMEAYKCNETKYASLFVSILAGEFERVGANIAIYSDNANYELYPCTEKFFDDKLVLDTLSWLDKYPKAKEEYKRALSLMFEQKKSYQVIDTLRRAFELFIKNFFGVKCSLENAKPTIGNYLKSLSVESEFCTIYANILDFYTTYNNNHTKHNNDATEIAVEFMVYQTGNLMRLLLRLKQEEKKGENGT